MSKAAALPGLLGRKRGMTRVFDKDGRSTSVTVIEAGPCVVQAVRTPERHGYAAVALAFDAVRPDRLSRPRRGQFPEGAAPSRFIREIRLPAPPETAPGASIAVGDVIKAGDLVDVTGVTKGRGFQGPVKRHGFGGGRETHGSNFHRRQGSIGAATDPGRVFPGRRMAGRMGGARRVVRNLRVVEVDAEANLLLLEGAVPGRRGGLVEIRVGTARRGASRGAA